MGKLIGGTWTLLVAAAALATFSWPAVGLAADVQIAKASIADPWRSGAADCKTHPMAPLEVRAYDRQTFVLRQGLCSTV